MQSKFSRSLDRELNLVQVRLLRQRGRCAQPIGARMQSSAKLEWAMAGADDSDDSNQFIITGTIAGKKVSVLIDSGATMCFINTTLIPKLQLKQLRDRAIDVTLGNSSMPRCDA